MTDYLTFMGTGLGLALLLLIIVVRKPIVIAGPGRAQLTATGRIKVRLLAGLVGMIEPVATRLVRYPRVSIASVERHVVPTSMGAADIDVYRRDPLESYGYPVHFHIHGGGFAVGGLASDAPWCRYLAHHAGCVVINIDYVLAPHRTFPAPVIQCHEIIHWVVRHAREFGIDPQRITIGGESAGGNLALAVALLAIERRDFTLRSVVPCVPVVDLDSEPATKNVSTERKQDLNIGTVDLVRNVYVPVYADRRNSLASPLLSGRLAELPSIFIVSAGHDIMYADALAFEAKLRASNTDVRHLCIREADHLFLHQGKMEHIVGAWDAMVSAIRQGQEAPSLNRVGGA